MTGRTESRIEVISTRGWLARELGGNTVLPVTGDYGLHLPAHPLASAWWMPAEHAARLLRQNVPLTFSAPGPRWLPDRLPEVFTGRRVEAFTVADTANRLRDDSGSDTARAWFCKPAEVKIDAFPAAWRSREELLALQDDVGMPPDAWIQATVSKLDLEHEVRCHVLDGNVVSRSLYLTTGTDGRQVTYYDGATCSAGRLADAVSFAREVSAELGTTGGQPSGYVLDVGWDRIRARWVVIEANPAWCAAWYGADLDGVVATIVRSCRPDPGWEWCPDAYLVQRAARMVQLPSRL